MRSTYLVAALMGGTALASATPLMAQQQEQQQEQQGHAAAEASCDDLAQLIADDPGAAEALRAELDSIIEEADAARCAVIVTTYEREGAFTQASIDESAEVVATEQAQETVTIEQEIDVGAAAAVYQPPPEISVDQPGAEVELREGQTEVTVNQVAPRIEVRQAEPRITVQMAQPTIRIEMPEPEIVMTYPDPEVSVASAEPEVAVRMGEPQVSVEMPEPIVELQLEAGQDAQERQLVQNEEGRYVPRDAAAEDLEPRIAVNTAEPVLRRTNEGQEPVVNLSRAEPEVVFQPAEPQVSVEMVGEPQIEIAAAESARVTIEGGAPGTEPQQEGQQDAAATGQPAQPEADGAGPETAAAAPEAAEPGQQAGAGEPTATLTVAQLRDVAVYGAGGDEVGTIDGVVESADGHAVLIERGGFLGIGGETLVIPVDAMAIDDVGRLMLQGATVEEITGLHDDSIDATRRATDEVRVEIALGS